MQSNKTVVHFIHNIGGNWRAACMPNVPDSQLPKNVMYSGEPTAVTCQVCKASNIHIDRMIAIKASEATNK